MALITKKTPEEKAAERIAKAEKQQAQWDEEARQAFLASPAGEARAAFDNGDHLFQYSADIMEQRAIVSTLASLSPGARTKTNTNDPTVILNSVCNEGWDLVNGSFIFAEEGTTSRKQLMSSKVQEAVKGTVIGYYLFRRCEANRA
jgi:hypothetical protein